MTDLPVLTLDLSSPIGDVSHSPRPSMSLSRPGSSSSIATLSSLASVASDASGSRRRRLPPSPADAPRPRRVRPLPSVPATPPTCPCSPINLDAPSQQPSRPRSLRPLPSLPDISASRSPSPGPNRSVSEGDLNASHGAMPKLSLDTTSFCLAPESMDAEPSPISASIPEPPTPGTARRRRMSKLRRHLGERPPSILVPAVPPLPQKAHIFGALADVHDSVALTNALETVQRVLDIEFDSASEGEYTEDENEEAVDKLDASVKEASAEVAQRLGSIHRPAHKYSKKWLREGRGRRETVRYKEVINALRVL